MKEAEGFENSCYCNDSEPDISIDPSDMITDIKPTVVVPAISSAKRNVIVFVLFLINLLNYMDRFTIAGVLIKVQKFYGIANNDTLGGLIQTSFIVAYMVCSPIFGYLGDRYSRKWLMTGGIIFWILAALGSSFVDQEYFYAFLITRALVGVGEASYSTIAPTIIADLFVGSRRTIMLMCFYFAIPVGSGLGYIVGSNVSELTGDWQNALRVTPALGVLLVILIILLVVDPPRGGAEGNAHESKASTYLEDLRYLIRHRSFILSSFGFTCVAFIAGALTLWGPKFLFFSYEDPESPDELLTHISLVFGIITVVTGFLGVALGAELARRLKVRIPNASPLVCAVGLLASGPFLFFALFAAGYNIIATYVFIFFGELFLSLNWCLTADILLAVVVPNRRATAEAGQILLSHALGDAGSPFLIGVFSDSFKKSHTDFVSMQYSLYICCFIAVLGGGFYLITSLYYERDRDEVDRYNAVSFKTNIGMEAPI